MEAVWVWLDWIGGWIAGFGLTSGEWLQATAHYASRWFFKSFWIFERWWGALSIVADGFLTGAIGDVVYLFGKMREVFGFRYMSVKELLDEMLGRIVRVLYTLWTEVLRYLEDWWTRALRVFETWWEKLILVYEDWWDRVYKWFDEWAGYLIWFFEEHEEKLLYLLTDGWLRLFWFIAERFEIIFATLEDHIDGWQMFVSDPAQALWDWFEVRATELVSDFLAEIW